MRTLWRAGILLLACGSSYSICAQTKAPPTAPATTAAKPEEDSYAREPYVFEPLDTRARFEADGAHENLGRVYVILKQVSAKSETTWLESAGVPASFPDEAEVKLVRRAKLTCVHSPVTCSLVLVSEETVRSVN